uniref:Coiled-coil domain-containing protein n=1 Tax=Caenorhabditis tropicalis TaxID=1561998 RepID=A0A1I7TT92_9PELO
MNQLFHLQCKLAEVQIENQFLKIQNEKLAEQVQKNELKDNISRSSRPVRRNLIADFSKLETQKLTNEIDYLKKKVGTKDEEILLLNTHLKNLETELTENKRIINQMTETFTFVSRSSNPEDHFPMEDQFDDFYSVKIRSLHEELQKTNEKLEKETEKNLSDHFKIKRECENLKMSNRRFEKTVEMLQNQLKENQIQLENTEKARMENNQEMTFYMEEMQSDFELKIMGMQLEKENLKKELEELKKENRFRQGSSEEWKPMAQREKERKEEDLSERIRKRLEGLGLSRY